MDRTNARHLESLPEPVDMVTIDVSFISLKAILPPAMGWLAAEGRIVALIKPQFEARRNKVRKGGVVRDPAVHRAVLTDLVEWAASRNLGLAGLICSPLRGPAGNVEYLAHWVPGAPLRVDVDAAIESCVEGEQ
jgi:23S rRNA (cytidine1920-2'-O)/16S rRNA (cytidine1409-2'-O)-methyltransferase